MNPLDTLAALPGPVAMLVGTLAPICIAVILWAVLPRRNRPGDHIERQIATLRKGADHSVARRPRVRAGGYQPVATRGTVKAPPRNPSGKPCGGGMCRKRIDCTDHLCPGVLEARLDAGPAARSAAKAH